MKTLRSKAYPANVLLNPQFRWTSSTHTDIRRLFARERKAIALSQPVRIYRIDRKEYTNGK